MNNNHEELADTLFDFLTTLKSRGFSDDQAFQLTREYMVIMLDNIPDIPPDEYPYGNPYDNEDDIP